MEIHRAGVVAHERRRCLEIRRLPGTLLRWSPWRTVALWKVFSGLDESKRPICERLAAVLERLIGRVPVGRLGRPEEVAAAVLWLYSDAASFAVGHAMVVDGGLTA
jgi:NAD(P)-dependent dehydrogenase (short-subunit alcohol dehydrogenase family)